MEFVQFAKKGELFFKIYQKHIHVFWIPFVPLWKKGIAECFHCKKVMSYKEIPENVQLECQNLKENTTAPLWQFTGLALIALFVTWVIYANAEDKKQTLEFIASPKIGDVYEIALDKGKNTEVFYTLYKVNHLTNDSVFVRTTEYNINQKHKIYLLNKEHLFNKTTKAFAKSEILKRVDDAVILKVKRN